MNLYWIIGMYWYYWYLLDNSVHYGKNAEYVYDRLTVIHGRITPFGNRRIKGVWLLPDAYRRHMRPSSARTPKASIISL